MSQATFTFRVDQELKNEFASAAESMDRTGAQLLRDYMRHLVRRKKDMEGHDAWFREQVRVGLESANAGNLVPSANVEAKFASRRTRAGRELD